MAEPDDYARRTARIKNLLSSYYGDAGGAPGSPSAGASGSETFGGAPASPTAALAGSSLPPTLTAGGGRPGALAMSLDSPAFDADLHLQQMLRGLPLGRLLAEHRGVAREIKNLDGDMQQLVYENYNKFIAATDTIKLMKSNVDAMEGDMDKLKAIMDDVSDRSASVNSKLQRRRQQCDELRRVGDLLAKLQAVFELPRRMRAALEEDALESAVEFYAEAQPLLAKYGSKGALAAVKAESDAAARSASAALKRRLAERRGDAERAVLLLRRLGEGDESLQDKYLQGRLDRMRRILADASAAADAMAAANAAAAATGPSGAAAAPPATPADAKAAAKGAFGYDPETGAPPALPAFVRLLGEQLVVALQETVNNVSSIFLQDDRSAARRKPLVKVAKDVTGDYFRVVRRAVDDQARAAVAAAARLREAEAEADAGAPFAGAGAASLAFSTDWGADAVGEAMAAVSADCAALHPCLPELGLRDWAAAAAEQAVRGHADAAVNALERRAAAALRRAAGAAAGSGGAASGDGGSGGGADKEAAAAARLGPAFEEASEAIHRCMLAMLQGLDAYSQRHSRLLGPLLPALGDAVAGGLQALLQGLAAACLAAARVKDESAPQSHSSGGGAAAARGALGAAAAAVAGASSGPPSTALLLLLARLCLFLEGSTVPAAMEALAVNFPATAGGPDAPPPFVAGEAARRLGGAGQALLGAFVEAHGRALTAAVEASTAEFDWLNAEEPTAPRPVCGALLALMARAEAEVSQLVEATGRAAGADGPRRDGGGGGGGGGSHHRGGSSLSDRDPGFALGGGAVERGVARLFRAKARITGPVKFTQASLLGAIAASGLKSLVECVRLRALRPSGLRQLQVDACYLRPALLRAAGGGEAVALLVEEVVAAGEERSVEPGQLLDPAAVERILSAAPAPAL